MSRYSSQVGFYLPQIKSSREVEDIVSVLSLSAARALRDLSKDVIFVDMYLRVVSENGYDNALYDDLVQLIADMVDASGVVDHDDEIDEIAGSCVMGSSAVFVMNDKRQSGLLSPEEYDIMETCVIEFDNMIRQATRPARQSNRRGGRDRVDRREYNGGNRDNRSRGSRSRGYDDDDGYGRRRDAPRDRRGSNRESYSYRGNNSDRRDNGRDRSGGRQPPSRFEPMYDGGDDMGRGRGQHTTMKDKLRTEERRDSHVHRQAQTVEETRGGGDVPVGGHYTVDRNQRSRRQTERDAVVAEPVAPSSAQETWYEKEDGSRIRIIPATMDNAEKRKSPYSVIPMFPITMHGYFTLNSSGDITGVIGVPKSEEDMERARHDASRFFKSWGNKKRAADHRATAKALGDIQTKAKIEEIEAQLAEKYDFDTLEELPMVEVDKLYVVKAMTTYEPHEDFVSTAQELLLAELSHEHVKDMFANDIARVPINYSAVEFYGISLTEDAARKAMEFKGLSSFAAIRNKLLELEPLVPVSTLHELDSIATNWVNDMVQYTLGIIGWTIDSFMSDIDLITTELAKEFDITTAFTSQAVNLVGSVLCPLNNKDESIRDLTGLSADGPFTVKFGKLTNITLIKIDSDKLGMYLEGLSGCVTRDSWSSLSMALDVASTLSKPNTAEMLLVTSDNRKIHVTAGKTTGEYILSR